MFLWKKQKINARFNSERCFRNSIFYVIVYSDYFAKIKCNFSVKNPEVDGFIIYCLFLWTKSQDGFDENKVYYEVNLNRELKTGAVQHIFVNVVLYSTCIPPFI